MRAEMSSAEVDERAELARLEAIWRQIEERLEAEKRRIVDEIGSYPHPIPACDAQFNALLEERVALLERIGEVKDIRKRNLSVREHLELLSGF